MKKLFYIITIFLTGGILLDAITTVIALEIPQIYPLHEISPIVNGLGYFGLVIASIIFAVLIFFLYYLYEKPSRGYISGITILFMIFHLTLIKYYAGVNNIFVILLQIEILQPLAYSTISTWTLLAIILVVPIFVVEEIVKIKVIRRNKIRKNKRNRFKF
jgi:hypothetical protein